MPTYEITAPDGKTLEITAPDGASQEQVLAYAQQQYRPPQTPADRYADLQKRAGTQSPEQVAQQTYDESPAWQRPLIAAGAEGMRLARGIGQLFTPDGSAVNRRLTAAADADAPYQAGVHGVSGFIGRSLPYLATIPLAPEVAALSRIPQAGRAAQLATKAGVAAAEGAGLGALGEVRTGESRGENAVVGALAGTAGRGAAGALGKAGNVVRNRWADPALQQANDYLTRRGIPVTLGDLGSTTSRFIENRLSPLFASGRNDVLQRQAQGVSGLAEDLAGTFTGQRQRVAAQLGLADASPEEIVAGGIQRRYQGNKAQARRLYDQVGQTATTPVPVAGSQGVIQRIVSEAPEVLSGFTTSAKNALDWLQLGGAARLGFDDVRALRDEVANAARAASKRVETGNADKATQNEARFLGQLKDQLERDIDTWGQATGNPAAAAYQQARQFFAQNVAPYRSRPEVRPYIKPDANPENIGQRLVANKPETAARVMQATDPAGRAAAKELFVQRAFDRATDPARDNISVFQLLKNLDTGKAGEKIFTKAEQGAIDKVAELAKVLSRSATAKSDPATGQLLASYVLPGAVGGLGGAVGDGSPVGTGLGVLAGLLAPRALNTATKSELVKRLVLTGTPRNVADSAVEKLSKQIVKRLPQGAAANQRAQDGLELDIAGGTLATPDDIARDRAVVGY